MDWSQPRGTYGARRNQARTNPKSVLAGSRRWRPGTSYLHRREAIININERTIVSINKVLPEVDSEEKRILSYVRSQLTPKGQAARGEYDQDVSHLIDVAERICKNHQRKESSHAERPEAESGD